MSSTEEAQTTELFDEYRRLIHAMQSGVAAEMNGGLNQADRRAHV